MTPLDPPAAAARRQYVLDRIVEDLVGWGCPLEHAEPRAAQLLDRVLDAGYALPAALQGPPAPRGPSTPEGRLRARLEFLHHPSIADDGNLRCACARWRGTPQGHEAHLADVLARCGLTPATGGANAGPTARPGAPHTRPPVPEGRERPTEADRGAEGVGR